jgi:predicted RNA methylase
MAPRRSSLVLFMVLGVLFLVMFLLLLLVPRLLCVRGVMVLVDPPHGLAVQHADVHFHRKFVWMD